MLVGSWLARTNWLQWNAVLRLNPAEGQAALRRFYLYAGIVLGAVATLTPAALLLREGLLMLLGESTGTLPDLLLKLIGPLSMIPVGLVVWIWHARVLHREAASFGESTEAATVRRVYYYLMTATGLALLWVGAVELLNGLIDYALIGEVWSERLATGHQPVGGGRAGVAHSLAPGAGAGRAHRLRGDRRAFFLATQALPVWRGPGGSLDHPLHAGAGHLSPAAGDHGRPRRGFLSPETAHLVAASLVAILFWVLHVLAIRGDTQLDRAQAATAPVLVVDAAARQEQLKKRIAALEGELAAAHAEFADLEKTG